MSKITSEIIKGEHDVDLHAIIGACKDRQERVRGILAASLKPGDEVRLINDIRPKYIAGAIVIIDDYTRAGFRVHTKHPTQGAFKDGFTVKASHLVAK